MHQQKLTARPLWSLRQEKYIQNEKKIEAKKKITKTNNENKISSQRDKGSTKKKGKINVYLESYLLHHYQVDKHKGLQCEEV